MTNQNSNFTLTLTRRGFAGFAAAATGAALGTQALPRVAAAQTPAAATGATAEVADAANAFLAVLTDEEKASVLFDWTNEEQKARWSNFPAALSARDGIMWGDLGEEGRTAWLALMQTTMSDEGYTRVMAEWNADDALKTMAENGEIPMVGPSGGNPSDSTAAPDASGTPDASLTPASSTGPQSGEGAGPTGGPGGASEYGTENFYIAIIGEPSAESAWQWQFTGHHVSVNATVANGRIAMTPSFIGVQPATYDDADGNEVRPIGDIHDDAWALMASLSADQQAEATIADEFIDLRLGPGQDGVTLDPEGLAVADMSADQQAMVTQLVQHYTGLVRDDLAAERLAEVTDEYASTYFVWAGPTEAGNPAYFRVAGPTIVIEYSPQNQLTNDPSEHIHGIYRDPSNDYGVKYQALS